MTVPVVGLFGESETTKSKRKGMGGHQSADSDTVVWLTPPEIPKALGVFDLDPCCHKDHPFPVALDRYYLPNYCGLKLGWHGRVWLNPPYGTKDCEVWLRKLATHGNGIALVFARTETAWFHRQVFEKASFREGKFNFVHGGKAAFPPLEREACAGQRRRAKLLDRIRGCKHTGHP